MSPVVFLALPAFIYALGFARRNPNGQIDQDLYADKLYCFMSNLEIFAIAVCGMVFVACWIYFGAKYGARPGSSRGDI